MKLVLMVAAASFISLNSDAAPVVQRNGVDGSFIWYPQSSQCWPHAANSLNISQPMNQSGVLSSESLRCNEGCFQYFGCEDPKLASISCDGPDVQVAGGGLLSYDHSCYVTHYSYQAAWLYGFNQRIDDQLAWTSQPLAIGVVGRTRNSVYQYGNGQFNAIRVHKPDGWHYGWLIRGVYLGTSGPGLLDGELRPAAYALESLPNTPITTPCAFDLDFDGQVDFFDYLEFVDYFSSRDRRADVNHDLVIDFFDYLDYVDGFSRGC